MARSFFYVTWIAGVSAALTTTAAQEGLVSFSNDIAPILQRSCAGCHKPGKAKGNLDLTRYDTLMSGGESGPAVKAGDPEESLLIQSVQGAPPDMPAEGEPLSSEEIVLLSNWIRQGAKQDGVTAVAQKPPAPPTYQALPAIPAIVFSPKQSLLAVAGHREVLLYEEDGDLVARLVGTLPRIDSIAFSPDGDLLAVAAAEPSVQSEIQLWNTSSQNLIGRYPVSSDSLFGLSFAPSGDRLAMGGADRMLRVIEIPSGKELIQFANHTDWVFATAFTQDGAFLASGSRDQSVRVLEADKGRFVSELAPQREPILCLAIHPTAGQLVYGGENGGVRVYKIDPKEGFKDPGDNKLHVRDYDHFGAPVYSVRYSNDGKWVSIAGARDEVRVHESANGHRVATLRGHRDAIYSASFSPDSSQIATAGRDGIIRIYKLPSGELLRSFPAVPLSPVRRNASIR